MNLRFMSIIIRSAYMIGNEDAKAGREFDDKPYRMFPIRKEAYRQGYNDGSVL